MRKPPNRSVRPSPRPREEPAVREPGYDAFAIASPGFAPLLAAELSALGVPVAEVEAAGVSFRATPEQLILVNLWSRLASRVIVRLAHFTARDFATLEKQAARVPWTSVVAPGSTVRFRVTCRKSKLYHSDAVAERVARGVSGAVKSATVIVSGRGVEPDEPTGDASVLDEQDDRPLERAVVAPAVVAPTDQLIIVRFEHDECTISADTSGDLLYRRGWRQAIAKAPLRETLAAAMLAACEWDGTSALVDPFCGSGTIGIEAALRLRNIAPGQHRTFACERWPAMSPAMVRAQRDAAAALARPSTGVPIVLRDRDAGACAAALANAQRAGVADDVEITQQPLSDTDLRTIGTGGLVLTNPPYGFRVSEGHDLRALFARLGDIIREGGPQWQLAALVPDRRLLQPTKLAFASLLRTSNGGIAVSVERSKAPGYARK
ncbi:MAG: hypothetical protein IT353_16485 [Gemmatimonadaceae bacterium]|nr:hypothetical protein [Gemmatimonadaceae bacterium]